MGVEPTENQVGSRRENAGNAGVVRPTAIPNFSSNQFFGVSNIEPFDPSKRNSFDNPDFLWPGKSYMDITGREMKMQRGYMRSLLTDPTVIGANKGINNRRLFFQFNPQLLVRSVQQSVGAMNPLLQDPAQLAQPIPGTASFGFELFFNREHEVAAGHNPTDTEYIELPNGLGRAFVSQVGVLADILVLDTIIGQGLSKDILDYINSSNNFYAQQSARRYNQIVEEIELLEKAGKKEEAEALRSVRPDVAEEQNKLAEAFNANVGNSAFLNPLPFRVLFSSLFMVEGVATSVDVQFQKFNRAMVPTQCRVTINMYALYIGFAKKETFLSETLRESFELAEEAIESSSLVSKKLDAALKTVRFTSGLLTNAGSDDGNFNTNKYFSTKLNADRSDSFKQIQKNKDVVDVKVKVDIQYLITTAQKSTVTESEISGRSAQLLCEGTSYETPIDKAVDERPKTWRSPELAAAIKEALDDEFQPGAYLHMRYVITVIAKASNSSSSYSESKQMFGRTLINLEFPKYKGQITTLSTTIPDVVIDNLESKVGELPRGTNIR